MSLLSGVIFGLWAMMTYTTFQPSACYIDHRNTCSDDFESISTVVDLLEEKNISWATYMESMPADGYQGFK